MRLQAKAFQKWVNVYLGMRKMHITNLYKDLSSGVALINLLEVLGGEKVCRKYNKRPKVRWWAGILAGQSRPPPRPAPVCRYFPAAAAQATWAWWAPS